MSLFDKFAGNKTRKDDLSKEEASLVDPKFGFKSFFKLGFHRLGILCKLNFLILLMLSPLLFTVIGLSGSLFARQIADTARSPVSALFPHYLGMSAYESGSTFKALMTPYAYLTTVNIDNAATIALKCLGLLTLFTFGPMNVGCVYVLRNMVREEHVFVWHDFFYAIRKNFRQALFFGIFDALCIFTMVYALLFYYNSACNFAFKMLLFAMIMIAFLYMAMRVCIYLMIVTFDLKFKKLLKYAFILSSAGIRRIVTMLLGVFLVFVLNVYLVILLRSVGLLLMCIFTVAFAFYICVYCAFPVVKKYMIDPFYDADGTAKEDPTGEEA